MYGACSYSGQAGRWRYYNVMLLEWEDNIAERRGLGFIFQDAADNSIGPGPMWKEILLA